MCVAEVPIHLPQDLNCMPRVEAPLQLQLLHRRLSVDSLNSCFPPPPLNELGVQWSKNVWKQKVPKFCPYLQKRFCESRTLRSWGRGSKATLGQNMFTFYTFWYYLFLPSISHMSSYFFQRFFM